MMCSLSLARSNPPVAPWWYQIPQYHINQGIDSLAHTQAHRMKMDMNMDIDIDIDMDTDPDMEMNT
jgi:hypothetical protein